MELLKEMQQTAREALDRFNAEQPEGPTELDAIVDSLYALVTKDVSENAVLLTEEEVEEVDGVMNHHIRSHSFSNNPLTWTCSDRCRKQALREAINDVLTLKQMKNGS